jgi:hypothetical protein
MENTSTNYGSNYGSNCGQNCEPHCKSNCGSLKNVDLKDDPSDFQSKTNQLKDAIDSRNKKISLIVCLLNILIFPFRCCCNITAR